MSVKLASRKVFSSLTSDPHHTVQCLIINMMHRNQVIIAIYLLFYVLQIIMILIDNYGILHSHSEIIQVAFKGHCILIISV